MSRGKPFKVARGPVHRLYGLSLPAAVTPHLARLGPTVCFVAC